MSIHVGCGLMDQERHILTGMMKNPTTLEEMRIAHICFLPQENGMIHHVPTVLNTFVKPMVGSTTIVYLILYELLWYIQCMAVAGKHHNVKLDEFLSWLMCI